MFDYIEQDSFLHRRNPVIKLAMIAVITVIVCPILFPGSPQSVYFSTYSFSGHGFAGTYSDEKPFVEGFWYFL